jgi:hypothetical protein
VSSLWDFPVAVMSAEKNIFLFIQIDGSFGGEYNFDNVLRLNLMVYDIFDCEKHLEIWMFNDYSKKIPRR